MLSLNEFKILLLIINNPDELYSQRNFSSLLDLSLGTVNNAVNSLLNKKAIVIKDGYYVVNKKAYSSLKSYKVDNAIIMAAGMSSRFAPISYELPKGLLNVKGEVLIERQIKQLKEKGIDDITVVVGYMKEKFYYLAKRCNVKIVVNEDYYKYNNTSTLIRILDKLKNTYICSSDNYFNINPFEKYVYSGYYSAKYSKGKTNEYCIYTKSNDVINKVKIGGNNAWYMIGHAYFDKNFSTKFKKILLDEYKNDEVKHMLWEDLYIKHIKELKLVVNKYKDDDLYEFDSLDELKQFDSYYINNVNSSILKNICKYFKCKVSDISNIKVIKSGLTNNSFVFNIGNNKYVYRHPGIGTEKYINRKSEAFSIRIASKLKLDNTFLYIDPKTGYKISKYIEGAKELDYKNANHVKNAINIIRTLHNENIKSKYNFGIWDNTNKFIKIIKKSNINVDVSQLYNDVNKIYNYISKDNVAKKILCHNDCYSPNFIIDRYGKMNLIDWEYSGNDDPASDIGTFICCSDFSYKKSIDVINMYFKNKATDDEILHYIGYIAICSFYWYVWSIYQEIRGNVVGEWSYKWYNNTIKFTEHFNKLLEKNYEK